MKIIALSVGLLEANCYIVYDEKSKDAMVIDPGGDGEYILSKIDEKGLKVRYIVLTHGHFDHIGATGFLKDKTSGLIAIHKLDAENLRDGDKNLSSSMGIELPQLKADLLLEHGSTIKLGDTECKILHTPGHSEGSICILFPGIVFTGDTLFRGSIGRTDFPGGNYKVLLKSIAENLLTLDDNTVVYPGHGFETSIGIEKETNPFLEGLS